jgi:hypothetical protein
MRVSAHGILSISGSGEVLNAAGRVMPDLAEKESADVAQLAEQLFCKQPVRSSSLLVGSQKPRHCTNRR